MGSTTAHTDPGSVEAAVRDRVRERSTEWFGLGATPAARLRRLADRPRSSLFLVELDGAGPAPRILAKVRKPSAAPPLGGGAGRPRLSADPLPAGEATAVEYQGLRRIHEALDHPGSPFGAVRPLDHLPEVNAILMTWLPGVPLRRLLTAEARLVPSWTLRRGGGPTPESAWRGTGAWLRAFQQAVPHDGLPPRTATAPEVVGMFAAYGAFLARRSGVRLAASLADEGAALADRALPGSLPVAAGHGDYAPRNVLIGEDGRLAVVDPLPRWSVPAHEDLCRLLVGIRLLGLQVHSRGLAYSRSWIEAVEGEVIAGFFGEGPVPVAELRCYQLLIMLDKWAALVGDERSGWAHRVRTRSAVRAGGYLHREGRRLLDLAASSG
jgi:hypothetical protein